MDEKVDGDEGDLLLVDSLALQCVKTLRSSPAPPAAQTSASSRHASDGFDQYGRLSESMGANQKILRSVGKSESLMRVVDVSSRAQGSTEATHTKKEIVVLRSTQP